MAAHSERASGDGNPYRDGSSSARPDTAIHRGEEDYLVACRRARAGCGYTRVLPLVFRFYGGAWTARAASISFQVFHNRRRPELGCREAIRPSHILHPPDPVGYLDSRSLPWPLCSVRISSQSQIEGAEGVHLYADDICRGVGSLY